MQQLYLSRRRIWSAGSVAVDLINEKTGLVYAEAGDELTPELLAKLSEETEVEELPVLDIDHVTIGPYLQQHACGRALRNTREEALLDIYRDPSSG